MLQVSKYIKQILDDLIKNLTNSQWRIRESRFVKSCENILDNLWRSFERPSEKFVVYTWEVDAEGK